MSKIKTEDSLKDDLLNKSLAEYRPSFPMAYERTPESNSYSESFFSNSREDAIFFSASLVNRLLSLKPPTLRNAARSTNEALEWQVFLKTRLSRGVEGLSKEELSRVMILFYRKRKGRECMVERLSKLGIEIDHQQFKSTEINHNSKQMYCEFMEKQHPRYPEAADVLGWLQQWFAEKACKRRMQVLCHQAEALGFFVKSEQLGYPDDQMKAAMPHKAEWIKEYLRTTAANHGWQESNFDLLFKIDREFKKTSEALEKSYLNVYVAGLSMKEKELRQQKQLVQHKLNTDDKELLAVEVVIQHRHEDGSKVRSEARRLLDSIRDSEVELQKIEHYEFCPPGAIWRLAESSSEDLLRTHLTQEIRFPQAYFWLDLFCCHSSSQLESTLEREARDQAPEANHLKYYLRFLKLEVSQARLATNCLLSYTNYFRFLQQRVNRVAAPPVENPVDRQDCALEACHSLAGYRRA